MSELPSVTRILQAVGLAPDLSHVSPIALEHARDRGRALHLAIQYHHEGALDESSLHEEIVPGFGAYLAWAKLVGFEPIASEVELIHPQWGYLGHPDCVGFHARGAFERTRLIVDFKYVASFDKHYVRLQLAGYRMLWDANHPEEPIHQVAGLHLKRDGTFAFYDVTDDDARQTFLAAVVVYRALQKRGKA